MRAAGCGAALAAPVGVWPPRRALARRRGALGLTVLVEALPAAGASGLGPRSRGRSSQGGGAGAPGEVDEAAPWRALVVWAGGAVGRGAARSGGERRAPAPRRAAAGVPARTDVPPSGGGGGTSRTALGLAHCRARVVRAQGPSLAGGAGDVAEPQRTAAVVPALETVRASGGVGLGEGRSAAPRPVNSAPPCRVLILWAGGAMRRGAAQFRGEPGAPVPQRAAAWVPEPGAVSLIGGGAFHLRTASCCAPCRALVVRASGTVVRGPSLACGAAIAAAPRRAAAAVTAFDAAPPSATAAAAALWDELPPFPLWSLRRKQWQIGRAHV